MSAPDSMPMLRFSHIEKSFSGARALKDVSFDAAAGRITGLVGENGAGKSTLMNALGGNARPDGGEIFLDGNRHAPRDAAAARESGVAFVHQELNLFPNLSIAENLSLARFPQAGPFINWKETRSKAADLLAQVGLQRAPDTLVEGLSTGERQLVEIAAALGAKPRVLILDEPTTSLTSVETERLFNLLRRLRDEGLCILYISHALGDVLKLCDDVVALRDGAVTGAGAANTFTPASLITLMVGRELDQLFPSRTGGPGNETLLEVNGPDVTFAMRRGEVLGISGLMGAGRTELARGVFGLDSKFSAEIRLRGRLIEGDPRARVNAGLAFLTESRREDGLCADASVADNMMLVTLRKHARPPLRMLNFGAIQTALQKMREAVRLQAAVRLEQAVKTLSGGNQQKIVLAKWLLAEPELLIVDEPTRGIDVGAKYEIYQLLHRIADRGAGVLVISSDVEELIGICDRILVMRQGRITDDVAKAEFDRERLLRAALPPGGIT